MGFEPTYTRLSDVPLKPFEYLTIYIRDADGIRTHVIGFADQSLKPDLGTASYKRDINLYMSSYHSAGS